MRSTPNKYQYKQSAHVYIYKKEKCYAQRNEYDNVGKGTVFMADWNHILKRIQFSLFSSILSECVVCSAYFDIFYGQRLSACIPTFSTHRENGMRFHSLSHCV